MPRSSRAAGSAVRPTARGWGFLGAAAAFIVASTLIDRREGLFIGFFLLALVTISGVMVWMVRPRILVRRGFDQPSVPAGETTGVRVVVEATGSARGLDRWREQLPAGFGEQMGDLTGVASDAHRFGGMIEYRVRPPRRGQYPIGPLWLGYSDPLGLAVALRPAGEASDLTVTPRVTPLDRPGVLTASGEGGRHQLYVPSNPRADELIAREYRAGDPLRRVHWRQTARRGELMVRQEEQQGDPEACVVLDTSVGVGAASGSGVALPGGADAEQDFERAVEAAASIAVRLLADGFAVTVVETVGPASGASDRPASRHRHYAPGAAATLLMDLADVRRAAVTDADDLWAGVDAVVRSFTGVLPVFCLLPVQGTARPALLTALRGLADPAVALVVGDDGPLAGTAGGVASVGVASVGAASGGAVLAGTASAGSAGTASRATGTARGSAGHPAAAGASPSSSAGAEPARGSLRDALVAAGWRAAPLTADVGVEEAWRRVSLSSSDDLGSVRPPARNGATR